ncbi:VOC family protein [Euzebya tangerina]|uniref:VOC family protein n=1 Tax=Euzebya tangerina TaxID=591198 RepID=UPI000E315EE7|nr:VOC family protein [Euzebya tangerina]
MSTTPPPQIDPNLEPPLLGNHDGFDVYPMPSFLSVTCADVAAATRFYVDMLGFAVMFTGPDVGGVPMVTHLRRQKYQDVLLSPSAPHQHRPAIPTFTVADVDDIADRLATGNPGPDGSPRPIDQPWGARDLTVTDPDGNTLVLTQAQSEHTGETIDEVMERAAGDRKP